MEIEKLREFHIKLGEYLMQYDEETVKTIRAEKVAALLHHIEKETETRVLNKVASALIKSGLYDTGNVSGDTGLNMLMPSKKPIKQSPSKLPAGGSAAGTGPVGAPKLTPPVKAATLK